MINDIFGYFITKKRIDLTKYNLQYIISLINNNIVVIDNVHLAKLKRNII